MTEISYQLNAIQHAISFLLLNKREGFPSLSMGKEGVFSPLKAEF
jgi:hypothetical protein